MDYWLISVDNLWITDNFLWITQSYLTSKNHKRGMIYKNYQILMFAFTDSLYILL